MPTWITCQDMFNILRNCHVAISNKTISIKQSLSICFNRLPYAMLDWVSTNFELMFIASGNYTANWSYFFGFFFGFFFFTVVVVTVLVFLTKEFAFCFRSHHSLFFYFAVNGCCAVEFFFVGSTLGVAVSSDVLCR